MIELRVRIDYIYIYINKRSMISIGYYLVNLSVKVDAYFLTINSFRCCYVHVSKFTICVKK